MPQAKENNIYLPTYDEVEAIAQFEEEAKVQIARAIKSIYRLQEWSGKALARRIQGVDEKRWQSYGRVKYDRPRHLHVVAALSWLTQISMSAFYRGDVSDYWSSVDQDTIECITYSCMIPTEQFANFTRQVLSKIEREGYDRRAEVENSLGKLSLYRDADYMMPNELSIREFGEDYYRSMATEFKRLRTSNRLSMETVATVLGISTDTYTKYESPNAFKNMPVEIGLRLKLGFKYDTVRFVSHMKKYPGFAMARKIQDLREQAIIALMQDTDKKLKSAIKTLAYSSMLFHRS